MINENSHRGFVQLTSESTLFDARKKIQESPNFQNMDFRFWFEKMGTLVELHQEKACKAEDVADTQCLVLIEHLEDVDSKILNLWARQSKTSTVPLQDLIRALFGVYGSSLGNDVEYTWNLVSQGISHFLLNISTTKPKVEMLASHPILFEDFQLFLKFYGPAKNCLHHVNNVYSLKYFHGFARFNDATRLLSGKPGAFLFRYSESQLKDGCFAFTVNKHDQIHNFSLKYSNELGKFIFNEKFYDSIGDFVTDPLYSKILINGLPWTSADVLQESKYNNPSTLQF